MVVTGIDDVLTRRQYYSARIEDRGEYYIILKNVKTLHGIFRDYYQHSKFIRIFAGDGSLYELLCFFYTCRS